MEKYTPTLKDFASKIKEELTEEYLKDVIINILTGVKQRVATEFTGPVLFSLKMTLLDVPAVCVVTVSSESSASIAGNLMLNDDKTSFRLNLEDDKILFILRTINTEYAADLECGETDFFNNHLALLFKYPRGEIARWLLLLGLTE